YHNEEQKALAEKTRGAAAAKAGIPEEAVQTAILPAGTFTYAEAYHQKYSLTRHRELRTFLTQTYPTAKELADSTVATRLNAWLGSGFDRDPDALANEIGNYGLPDKLRDYVLSKAGR
ncbi:MAG: peptide-methionine (S)-S-oxide reductase, partial [Akkermansiaceae bacterium]|nr:peptide-methionine (S)-S-oxide reductase [Akkermansiaceae bacterium]